MATFKHFIITQFNIRLWSKDKRNVSTYTEEWLSRRFDLFDAYCFPSVSQQTNTEFVWLCLFDKNTPAQYLPIIESYKAQCPQMVSCFLGTEETLNWLGYAKGIMDSYMSGEDYIITTNLDNDDAIHLNMVKAVHEQFMADPKTLLISFVNGYQYFVGQGIMLKMDYPHNHFLSLIEKYTPQYETIKCMSHAKMRKHFEIKDIRMEPYWIEFVHASNVNNDLRITSRIKYYPVFKTLPLSDFGLSIVLPKATNIRNTLLKMPFLFLKTAASKLTRKLNKKKK